MHTDRVMCVNSLNITFISKKQWIESLFTSFILPINCMAASFNSVISLLKTCKLVFDGRSCISFLSLSLLLINDCDNIKLNEVHAPKYSLFN